MVSGQNIHKLSAKSDLLGAQVRAPPPPLLVSAYKNHKCLEGLGEARSNRGRTAGEPRVEQATSEGDGASEGIPPCRPPDSAPERGRAQNGRWLACARVRLAATRSRVKQKARGLSPWPAVFNGASNRTRTDDPRFTRAVLYQLSYAGNSTTASQRIEIIRVVAIRRKGLPGFFPPPPWHPAGAGIRQRSGHATDGAIAS